MSYDPLFVQFIYYFNIEKDFYECHEVLEELWLEEGRSPFYQGLLQVAVGLYHHSYGNVIGARKIMAAGIEKLRPYPSDHMGIDLGTFIADASEYLQKLLRIEVQPFDFYTFDIHVLDEALAAQVVQFMDLDEI